MTDDMTDEEDEDIMSKYWGVIDPVDNSVDYDRLLSVVKRSHEVWQLREENEKLTKTLDYFRTENESLKRASDNFTRTTFDSFVKLLKETEQLRKDIEGYKAIWDYLDPKGHAWEEEEFVALLKEHGFEVGEEKWEYEDEGNHEHMTVKCKWCSKEIQVPFEEPPNKYGYGCWECHRSDTE